MLVAGLWSGSKKPPMDIFLQPLVTSMKHLNENGLGYIFNIMFGVHGVALQFVYLDVQVYLSVHQLENLSVAFLSLRVHWI